LRLRTTCAIEEIQAFAWGDETEYRADLVPESGHRALCGISQACFEFCEGLLDGVKLGRAPWHIAQLPSDRIDDASDFIVLVGERIIHHHDVS
jgi:hypothetical protein